LRAYPNPFSGSVRFGVQKHRAGRVRLEVYDRAGRLVRTLADRVGGAEVKHCEWDGLDAAGQPVPDGVYFVELRVQDGAPGRDAPTRVATVKVVKAR
jgi:flagellar hook assembly protein FlgD